MDTKYFSSPLCSADAGGLAAELADKLTPLQIAAALAVDPNSPGPIAPLQQLDVMNSRPFLSLFGFLGLTFLAPLAGAAWPPGEWYRELAKPAWTPPGWVFGPAWTVLYLLMATAAWRVWRRVGWTIPLRWWLAQLALNAMWTPIFFGLQRPGWAFAEILLLWLTIAVTLRRFIAIERWSGFLLVPYLLWVSFAAALNFAIWRLNV